MARQHQRFAICAFAICIWTLLAACIFGGQQANQSAPISSSTANWACPTPMPKPYGPDGPPKREWDETNTNPDGTTSTTHHREDYEIWEQEYGSLGGPPFPAPTPYTRSGASFYLGQLVNLAGNVDSVVTVDPTATTMGEHRLYDATIHWVNRGQPFAFDPARQLVISAVKVSSGRVLGGSWSWTQDASGVSATAVTTATLHTMIAAGESDTHVPIYAPEGQVQVVDMRLDPPDGNPNVGGELRIQFSAAIDPLCGKAGTNAYKGSSDPIEAPPNMAALPPGQDPLIGFALQQVGRPYCWGGKGWSPCSGCDAGSGCVTPSCATQGGTPCWDCSGLTWGAYNSIGNPIGQGTGNQQRYQEIPISQLQPGDLMLFSHVNAQGRNTAISHVGLYAGDLDGDGTGDMIHAANYPDGVIISKNVLNNPYYKTHLVVITRPPRH